MRKPLNKKITVTRFIFLILIIISVIAGPCTGRKSKLDKKNLIPEKDLISLLTDIHIADGLLSLPTINSWYSSLDSITAYSKIIEMHGYTKEAMDKTMKYYFVENPKRLSRIYDQVLGILSEMESRVEKESIKVLARVSNLWPGKDFYCFPSLSGNDSSLFDITLYRSGYYTLSFSATLFPDDQSVYPRLTAYTSSPDSIDSGKKNFIKSINYIKDGRPHGYNLTFPVHDQKIRHLRGWLYDFDNPPLNLEKHIKIENISLTYSSAML